MAVMLPEDGLSDGVVRLRAWVPEDLDWVTAAIQGDREISRWTRIPWPYARAHAEEWFARAPAGRAAGTDIGVAIVDAETAEPLGAAGLHHIGVIPDPSTDFLENEVGYWLWAPARGRGVTTRAVRLLVTWAFETLDLGVVRAGTLWDNDRSGAVLRRVGFEEVGEAVAGADLEGGRMRCFELRRERFSLVP